jgi:hypothetical protein
MPGSQGTLPYYWSLFERGMIKRWSWSLEPFFCSQDRTRESVRERRRDSEAAHRQVD